MTPEFSRPVRLDTLGEGPRAIEIAADEAERKALAARFQLLALDRLEAKAELTRAGEIVHLAGRLAAKAVQACVATGAPVPAAIDEAFALRFVPEGGEAAEEMELGEGDLDDIGYAGSAVDLGEAVAQSFALALDPFPRASGADKMLRAAGVIPEEEAGRFSGLKGLRDLLDE